MAGNGRNGFGGSRADEGIRAEADQYTGAYLVLLDQDDMDAGMAALADQAGTGRAEVLGADDVGHSTEVLDGGGSVLFSELGVAVVPTEPDQRRQLTRTAAQTPQILAVEKERVLFISQGPSVDYLRGYRDGIDHLVDDALAAEQDGVLAMTAAALDESTATWGLQVTRVLESRSTGAGVRVAVLDTGVDSAHRDLADRVAKTESFIAGQAVDDGHGHGTHCIGTACGPSSPNVLPRYGVAVEAEVFAGKVLSDQGSGGDRGIIAGINWAVSEGCKVVSMSLGAPTELGEKHSPVYEAVARRAMRKGTLIVAAAGNESRRPARIAPVAHPANCPSILAVAALTRDLAVAPFSCAGLNPNGGQVDIAAPGVDVLSSWPEPTGYRRLQGTSMATPHVAGVVALLAEANPTATAAELKELLVSTARRLQLPATDVGAGLVQAP